MKISHSRLQSYRAPQAPGKEGSAQVFKATSDEAETQARHSIVQGELHFGRRDLGRTCLAAGACSTTTGGETAALLPLMAMCRTPWALTSTHRRGVVNHLDIQFQTRNQIKSIPSTCSPCATIAVTERRPVPQRATNAADDHKPAPGDSSAYQGSVLAT